MIRAEFVLDLFSAMASLSARTAAAAVPRILQNQAAAATVAQVSYEGNS